MNEMIGYIFGNLKITETAIRGIRKNIRGQKEFNHKIVFALGMITGHMLINNAQVSILNNKIKRLENEIENLKAPKGE